MHAYDIMLALSLFYEIPQVCLQSTPWERYICRIKWMDRLLYQRILFISLLARERLLQPLRSYTRPHCLLFGLTTKRVLHQSQKQLKEYYVNHKTAVKYNVNHKDNKGNTMLITNNQESIMSITKTTNRVLCQSQKQLTEYYVNHKRN